MEAGTTEKDEQAKKEEVAPLAPVGNTAKGEKAEKEDAAPLATDAPEAIMIKTVMIAMIMIIIGIRLRRRGTIIRTRRTPTRVRLVRTTTTMMLNASK